MGQSRRAWHFTRIRPPTQKRLGGHGQNVRASMCCKEFLLKNPFGKPACPTTFHRVSTLCVGFAAYPKRNELSSEISAPATVAQKFALAVAAWRKVSPSPSPSIFGMGSAWLPFFPALFFAFRKLKRQKKEPAKPGFLFSTSCPIKISSCAGNLGLLLGLFSFDDLA